MARKHRQTVSDFPLHVTARTNGKAIFPIPLDEAWTLFSNYLFLIHILFDIRIHSFVMMPNHIHLILSDPGGLLSQAMACLMRETSKEIGRQSKRNGLLWGSRFHSSIIASPTYYLNAYKYVYRNPVRAGIVDSPFKYKYSTLPVLVGLSHSVIPIESDSTLFENFENSVRWLETAPNPKIEDAIRGGLRRWQFAPLRDERTKLPHVLEFEDFSGK